MRQTIGMFVRASAASLQDELAELQRLRDRIAELEALLGARDADLFPIALPAQQRAILGLILRRASVTVSQIAAVIYGGRVDCDWRLRKTLKDFGITIETSRVDGGAGAYAMSADNKAKVRVLIAGNVGSARS